MIPLGDYPNPPTPQWVTRVLIAINIAIYVFVSIPMEKQRITLEDRNDPEKAAILDEMFERVLPEFQRSNPNTPQAVLKEGFLSTLSRYDLFVTQYGYRPGSHSLLSLLICMFLHSGFMHLAGNMLFLWIYGDNVEYRLGRVAYLLCYLGTGAIATLSFAMANAGSMVPLVGASGAISGVLGCYLVWFPHNYIRVLLLLPLFITWVHIRAVFVLAVYLLFDNILPAFAARGGGAGGGVAHLAHIGGFVAGVVIAFGFDRIKGRIPPPRPQRGQTGSGAVPRRSAPREAVQQPGESPTTAFEHAIDHSRMEDAAHAFVRISREGGQRPQERSVFVLANWLYENDFIQDGAAVFRYYLKNYPQGDNLDRVNLGLGILLSRRLGQPAGARQYLLAAIDLTPSGSQVAEVAKAELDRIGG